MSATIAAASEGPAVKYDFIRELAQHRPISPDSVFRRLKFIGIVFGVSSIGVVALCALIALDGSLSVPAKLLAAFGLVAAIVLALSALISAGLLLWGGFISQYVAALDAKAQVAEVLLQDDVEIEKTIPTQANEEMVQTVTDDALTIATAMTKVVDQRRQAEILEMLAELRAATSRMRDFERSLSTGEHQRVFSSLRPQFMRIHLSRLWVEEPADRANARPAAKKAFG